MRLAESEPGDGEQDESSGSPLLDVRVHDADLGHFSVVECEQRGPSRADIIGSPSHCPDDPINQVQCDRDVDIYASIQRSTWYMYHDGNNEAKEGDEVLNNKDLV